MSHNVNLPPGSTRRKTGLYNPAGRLTPSIDQDRGRLTRFQYPAGHDAAWAEIKAEVWEYANRVLPKMIEDGRIWRQYRKLGGGGADLLARTSVVTTRQERRDLAADVILKSIPIYYEQLKRNKWDPTKNTMMVSWFTNLCVLRFPKPWRDFISERVADNLLVEIDANLEAHVDERPDAIIYTIEFERYLERIDDEDTRTMIRLDATEHTDKQIAARINVSRAHTDPITRKIVEHRLSRARKDARTHRAREAAREELGGIAATGS
jgi:hypothetical protein